MNDQIAIGTKRTLKECGYSESWLEDQVVANPAILGLGDGLRVVYRQREQSSGGCLDLLLEDTDSDDKPMYEVELMLGKTDASHIIRTIEYWDNEKRKWPKRSHTAVLVAEFITTRFFNVIRLLGDVIPIVAIQADVIEADGNRILHFSKVLDTYTEPQEGGESAVPADEGYWQTNAPETLALAKKLRDLLQPQESEPLTLHVTQGYISICLGDNDWLWFHRRAKGISRVNFYLVEPFLSEAIAALKNAGLEWKKRDNYSDGTNIYFSMTEQDVGRLQGCISKLYQLGKKSIVSEPLAESSGPASV